MAFYHRSYDPRFDDPFRDQRTASRFDGAGLWFLAAMMIVITGFVLFGPGPGSQMGITTISPSHTTNTSPSIQTVAPTPSPSTSPAVPTPNPTTEQPNTPAPTP